MFQHSKIYTGVGSRSTPKPVLSLMQRLATRLTALGYKLRSGAADGADRAFESGAEFADIYLPWKGFNGSRSPLFDLPTAAQAEAIAASVHPRWASLAPPVRRLHLRNVYQVLGEDLKSPSNFVVCWTPDGAQTEQERSAKTGGTGTAIALAACRGVPVINLQRPESLDRLADLVTAERT